eukprot:3240176-Pyramimonas_sp.AAC.1
MSTPCSGATLGTWWPTPSPKAAMAESLHLSVMDGHISYDHGTVGFSDEKLKKAVQAHSIVHSRKGKEITL